MKKQLLVLVSLALVVSVLRAQENTWRGIPITPESECTPYDRDDYRYPPSVEDEIIRAMDGDICSPYTETCFDSKFDTDIEHIIALSEAHDSGLCAASADVKKRFAADLRNLTLAPPTLNRGQKGAKDAAEWLPDFNRCWFAERIVEVRLAYQLTIDRREADALEAVLVHCDDLPTEYRITGIANLRSCASITCELLLQLAPDQDIAVIEMVAGTPWLRVQTAGETGYVHASSITEGRLASTSSSANPPSPSCGDPATTNCSELKACYGHGAFPRDHPGYHPNRDRNNDGVACE